MSARRGNVGESFVVVNTSDPSEFIVHRQGSGTFDEVRML